jgi:BirA family biotin operon repressor/biotin-[acetyl-CoA-carboxylase] ligase
VERRALDLNALRAAVGPRWARVEVVQETASTNADLLSDSDAPDHSVLAAEFQTAGRGRFERAWTSPPRAGLTFSVLLRPTVPLSQWGWLPLLAGVAVHEAVGHVPTQLKWPNDLLAQDGRKLAGILVQTSGGAVVVGVGLNVSTTAAELPVETATSLALCGGGEVDRTALLASVLTQLDARYLQWMDAGGDATASGLATAYRRACVTLGQRVRVTLADGDVIEGEARDVDELGRLIVGTAAISAGDVEHVRVD